MLAMSESFVDLSYRGLALGKRIKLTQVRPTTGYLEMPTPMPVGTAIGIATDDGVLVEAVVAEVHEQVGGSDRPPGMVVRPKLDADAAQEWWKTRADLPAEKAAESKPAPAADPEGKVTVVSRRMSGEVAVPELVDDGRSTAVMDAIDPNLDTQVADVPLETAVPQRDSSPKLEDDGKRTMMMDAVDLAALGLDPAAQSGQMAAVKAEDYADDDNGSGGGGGTGGDKPEGKSKKKRKRR
jgi:hypothetical protein